MPLQYYNSFPTYCMSSPTSPSFASYSYISLWYLITLLYKQQPLALVGQCSASVFQPKVSNKQDITVF